MQPTSFLFLFLGIVSGELILPALFGSLASLILPMSLSLIAVFYEPNAKTLWCGILIASVSELMLGLPFGSFSVSFILLILLIYFINHFLQISSTFARSWLDYFLIAIIAIVSFFILEFFSFIIGRYFYHINLPWRYFLGF